MSNANWQLETETHKARANNAEKERHALRARLTEAEGLLARFATDDPYTVGDMDNVDSYCCGCGAALHGGPHLEPEPHNDDCRWVAARAFLSKP